MNTARDGEGVDTLSKKVFLYGKSEKPGVSEAAEQIESLLGRMDGMELVGKDLQFGKDLSALEADLILALGGDGTVLYLARHLFGKQIPVISVNLGRLGFLAEVGLEDAEGVLKSFAQGKAHISRRMMLECEILDANGERVTWLRALNDAVVGREAGRMITVEVACQSTPIMSYSGDGVIVNTPSPE